MIDRLVHHAEVVALKGDSYRLKDRDLGPGPRRRETLMAAPATTPPVSNCMETHTP